MVKFATVIDKFAIVLLKFNFITDKNSYYKTFFCKLKRDIIKIGKISLSV